MGVVLVELFKPDPINDQGMDMSEAQGMDMSEADSGCGLWTHTRILWVLGPCLPMIAQAEAHKRATTNSAPSMKANIVCVLAAQS